MSCLVSVAVAEAFPGQREMSLQDIKLQTQKKWCYFLKLGSFIKTRSFRMTKTHTRSRGLEVTQCRKAQALIHDSFLVSL